MIASPIFLPRSAVGLLTFCLAAGVVSFGAPAPGYACDPGAQRYLAAEAVPPRGPDCPHSNPDPFTRDRSAGRLLIALQGHGDGATPSRSSNPVSSHSSPGQRLARRLERGLSRLNRTRWAKDEMLQQHRLQMRIPEAHPGNHSEARALALCWGADAILWQPVKGSPTLVLLPIAQEGLAQPVDSAALLHLAEEDPTLAEREGGPALQRGYLLAQPELEAIELEEIGPESSLLHDVLLSWHLYRTYKYHAAAALLERTLAQLGPDAAARATLLRLQGLSIASTDSSSIPYGFGVRQDWPTRLRWHRVGGAVRFVPAPTQFSPEKTAAVVALELLNRSLAACGKSDASCQNKSLNAVAWVHAREHHFPEALASLQKSLEIVESSDDEGWIVAQRWRMLELQIEWQSHEQCSPSKPPWQPLREELRMLIERVSHWDEPGWQARMMLTQLELPPSAADCEQETEVPEEAEVAPGELSPRPSESLSASDVGDSHGSLYSQDSMDSMDSHGSLDSLDSQDSLDSHGSLDSLDSLVRSIQTLAPVLPLLARTQNTPWYHHVSDWHEELYAELRSRTLKTFALEEKPHERVLDALLAGSASPREGCLSLEEEAASWPTRLSLETQEYPRIWLRRDSPWRESPWRESPWRDSKDLVAAIRVLDGIERCWARVEPALREPMVFTRLAALRSQVYLEAGSDSEAAVAQEEALRRAKAQNDPVPLFLTRSLIARQWTVWGDESRASQALASALAPLAGPEGGGSDGWGADRRLRLADLLQLQRQIMHDETSDIQNEWITPELYQIAVVLAELKRRADAPGEVATLLEFAARLSHLPFLDRLTTYVDAARLRLRLADPAPAREGALEAYRLWQDEGQRVSSRLDQAEGSEASDPNHSSSNPHRVGPEEETLEALGAVLYELRLWHEAGEVLRPLATRLEEVEEGHAEPNELPNILYLTGMTEENIGRLEQARHWYRTVEDAPAPDLTRPDASPERSHEAALLRLQELDDEDGLFRQPGLRDLKEVLILEQDQPLDAAMRLVGSGELRWQASLLERGATALMAEGRPLEAAKRLAEAGARVSGLQAPEWKASLLVQEAEARRRGGDAAAARGCLEAAISLVRALQNPGWEAALTRALAETPARNP